MRTRRHQREREREMYKGKDEEGGFIPFHSHVTMVFGCS